MDFEGNIIEVNSAFFAMLDYAPADLPILKVPDLYVDVEDWNNAIALLTEYGQFLNETSKRKRKDGTEIFVKSFMVVLEISGEKRILFLCEDITEKKQAEMTLQDLYEKTLDVSTMKTNLITFTSHELKTPLTPILGWIDYLKMAQARGVHLDEAQRASS